ncbi:HMG box domain-containing protein [Caerostris extrusa]|uniref:HMG box domain-containing protein n=1 Tax=Caerostris extrusa TaxID=172846 RepID=A0AAV4TXR9_CAEEX|nr:HMG box domain-containing protein [Caerostris extrusa]
MVDSNIRRSNRSVKGVFNNSIYGAEDSDLVRGGGGQLEPSLTDLILKPKANKIARPPNAFMLYAREHRKSLASEYPTHNNKNISSLLGNVGEPWTKRPSSSTTGKPKCWRNCTSKNILVIFTVQELQESKKMARKKKNVEKCNANNLPIDNEMQLEPIEPVKSVIVVMKRMVNGTLTISNRSSQVRDTFQTIPQYFPETEHIPEPEVFPTPENNVQGPLSQTYVYPSCPPPPWNNPPGEPVPVSFPGRHSEECEMQPGTYVDNYYPRNVSSNAYDCNTWERYHDSVYEPSMTHSWNACSGSCSLGCRRECSAIQPNVEQEHFAHLPPSAPYPEYQNTYYNCNSATACCNPHPLPYTYEPCRDSKMMVCNGWPRTCAHWKTPSNAPPPYYYQNMDYYCNQSPDYFRGCYAKCPTEYDYSSEVYDSRQAKRKETGEPVTAVQTGESPSQYVEQENVESNADEIVNVVDEDDVEPKVLPFLSQDDNGAITSSAQLQIGAAQNVI